ncbi:MAG: hypothetical protein CL843_14815 [Crocinitomicaceae bacterium]|nr:hypothetical protein [Crocinitomicaceae bacterium]|tara:strand:- start:619 stop:1026 length:408 start_codon:yes stop_codon:yes gene_type:complete
MNEQIGTFITSYEVSTGDTGAPTLKLNLVVTTPTKTVNGSAEVSQTINPPFNAHYEVSGDFTYMTVMPNNTHIMVKLTGISGPQFGLTNFKAYLVLNDDWSSGVCNFSYINSNGEWNEIQDARVTKVSATEYQPA